MPRKGKSGASRRPAARDKARGPAKALPAASPVRVFAVPPAPKSRAPVARPTPVARVFAEPPTIPTLKDVLLGTTPGSVPYGLPPRDICDECGARPAQRHTSECSYAGYPTLIQDPDFRPAVARELKLPVTRCGVCRCPVLGTIDYDRTQHKWWCTWWDAHPDVPPPF